MSNMWPMMKGFARDFRAYRTTLGKQDAWIRKHAANRGWSVNPRWMVYTNLRLWLSDCEEMYGKRYCPCFEPSGEPDLDRKLICPCEFAQAEIDEVGWCHCTLFGRADLTAEDYKRAEASLMAEYRDTPLTWVDGVLDTRGQEIEKLRGLPVPDAIHQVKRALNGKGAPVSAIVATRAEVSHLEALGRVRGLQVTSEGEDGAIRVTLK
jgi:ferredoxin-thioredoxin reductase catalytic subunit